MGSLDKSIVGFGFWSVQYSKLRKTSIARWVVDPDQSFFGQAKTTFNEDRKVIKDSMLVRRLFKKKWRMTLLLYLMLEICCVLDTYTSTIDLARCLLLTLSH